MHNTVFPSFHEEIYLPNTVCGDKPRHLVSGKR